MAALEKCADNSASLETVADRWPAEVEAAEDCCILDFIMSYDGPVLSLWGRCFGDARKGEAQDAAKEVRIVHKRGRRGGLEGFDTSQCFDDEQGNSAG